MLTKRIKELEGKKIAIVAMGVSQIDFHLALVHSKKFDEVWVINAMIGVVNKADRAFILDPMSRFFDSDEAASMTQMMREELPKVDYPIYSCELDSRVPAVRAGPAWLERYDPRQTPPCSIHPEPRRGRRAPGA